MTDETHHDTDGAPQEKAARMDLSKVRDMPLPERKVPREIKVDLPPYDQRKGVSAHDRLQAEKDRRPGPVAKLARTFVGFAIFAVLLLGVFGILSAIDDDKKPQAAWSQPSAPVVKPVNLDDY